MTTPEPLQHAPAGLSVGDNAAIISSNRRGVPTKVTPATVARVGKRDIVVHHADGTEVRFNRERLSLPADATDMARKLVPADDPQAREAQLRLDVDDALSMSARALHDAVDIFRDPDAVTSTQAADLRAELDEHLEVLVARLIAAGR